jgi:hypothetical protein
MKTEIGMKFFLKVNFLFSFLLISFLNYSQGFHPLQVDGYYSLEGPIESTKRQICDKNGFHIGNSNFDWLTFDNIFYQNSVPFTGILYQVINKRIMSVGELKNGQKSGIWIMCNSDSNDEENYSRISEYYYYQNNKIIVSKKKRELEEHEVCFNTGFYTFTSSDNLGIELFDQQGRKAYNEEFDGSNGLFNKNQIPFTGICYLNDMGACFYFIGYYKDAKRNGLMINSNEGGYLDSFGILKSENKSGRWIQNHYTGAFRSIGNFTSDQKNGDFIFYDEEKFEGKGTYDKGELLNCNGICEEY